MGTEGTSEAKKFSRTAGSRLKQERESRAWTQNEVAERIGTTQINISRWENSITVPSPYYRQKLGELFGKSIAELGLVPEKDTEPRDGVVTSSAAPASHDTISPLPIWHVPYRRNPFFTGREEILTHLYATFRHDKAEPVIQIEAITGLGGIGKTQIAVEYVHRYRDEYQAVFWITISTQDALIADFAMLAALLGLPEGKEQDQNIVLRAVKRWLTAADTPWLLILDNVDDLKMIVDFLPTHGTGDVLLTTRLQALGTVAAHSIEIEKMSPDEAVLFLLRRTKVIAPETPLQQATKESKSQAAEIVAAMDGLPLALDQAGAYIEETRSGLSQYLKLYATRRKGLLMRRGRFPIDHPDPVATTWSLSFQKVEQENQAAADLLRLFAFLGSEAIPEEIIALSTKELGSALEAAASDPLGIDTIIELLLRYSLVRRIPELESLSIHRLVQAVLKDGMERDTQRVWAERAIKAVNLAFPDVESKNWERCQRYLPHVQVCATYSEEYELALPEAARLFNEAAAYLIIHASYKWAEFLLLKALRIRQQVLKADHPDTARTLNDLGELYLIWGRYQEAEHFLQEGLLMRQRVLGEEHPDVAQTLYNLASLSRIKGAYTKAERLYSHALSILEPAIGIKDSLVARCYYGLARVYYSQGEYHKAEKFCKQALTIQEQVLGENHPRLASTLSVLAKIYQGQNQLNRAKEMNRRALRIRESISGPDHSQIATIINSLVEIYHAEGKYREAEPLIARSIKIHKESLGPEHPYMAYSLSNKADNLFLQGDYAQAESYYKEALAIRELHLGLDHPHTASTYSALAGFYVAIERYEEAAQFYDKALSIRERTFGRDYPIVANTLEQYTIVLRRLQREC